MSSESRGPRGTDPLLLVEAALVLILFALFVFLFLLPAGRPPFVPRWWTWLLVGSAFFGVVGLDAWRRKRGRRRDHRPDRTRREARAPRRDEPVPPAP
jgi:membrane protein implicated in regulation of membrane protease activity